VFLIAYSLKIVVTCRISNTLQIARNTGVFPNVSINITVKWSEIQLCIRKDPSSTLGLKAG
jgi:hypothetical protein